MEPKQGMATSLLTNDLVVEILSWLPLKSFCRFKCVCKAWLAFSSDPYYCQKLPRIPAGLLYQKYEYSMVSSDPYYCQKFRNRRSWEYGEHPISEVEIFFSEDSTWYSSLWEHEIGFYGSLHFIHGVLYVEHLWMHCVLAMDAPDTCTRWLSQRTIKLPGFPADPQMFDCFRGRLAQSTGVLCYAQQEIDGCMMRIWSLEGSSPDRWVVKHRLSMIDALGRGILFRANHEGKWCFDYDILAFDLERELVILVDRIADKVLLFSISTGKLSEIRNDTEPYLGFYYLPYYCKFPASVL